MYDRVTELIYFNTTYDKHIYLDEYRHNIRVGFYYFFMKSIKKGLYNFPSAQRNSNVNNLKNESKDLT